MTNENIYTTPDLLELGDLTGETLGLINVGPEAPDMKQPTEGI